MEAASSGSSSSSKAPLGAFFGSTGGSFSQKKRVSLCNVKHFGIKGGVSLAKPHSDEGMYSDMESDFSNSFVDDILVGSSNKSFLGLAATTPKAKRVKNDLACSSLLGSLDYDMADDNDGFLLLPLAVEGKSAMAKTQVIRKLFSKINGFGGATTLSKFEEIIRLMFTSSESIEKAVLLARENNVIVNSNLKRQEICSDQAVVIKKIPMDMPKEIIVTTVSKFGQAVVEFAELSQADWLAAKWSFLIGKDSVCVAKAVGDFHDLGDLLTGTGGKTCIINHSLDTGNRVCCAVVCFENDEVLESVFCTEHIFGGVRLFWARLDLVRCEWYGKLGYSVLEYNAEISTPPKLSKLFKRVVSDEDRLQLAKLYVKKSVSISQPAAFGGRSWAQVVSLISLSNSPHFGFSSGFGFSSDASGVVGYSSPVVPVYSFLETCLASLERSLELFTDRVSGIVNKLDNLNLVPMALTSSSQPLVIPVMANVEFGSDMVLDNSKSVVLPLSSVSSGVLNLGSSSSKILTSKVGCLELKLMALEALVCLVLEKLDQMCAGSGSADDVLKSGIKPWIMNKFPDVHIFTSGLDTDSSGAGMGVIMNFSVAQHALAVNSLITSAINSSSFVVLGGDFNKSDTKKSASLKKYADLGLDIGVVMEFFNTDHKMISVSIGLKSLLDAQLNSICKQANRNRWKFDFKDADPFKWLWFKDNVSAALFLVIGSFLSAKVLSNLDEMWDVLCGIMVRATDATFSRHWFSEFDCSKNRHSSRFLGLELLVAKVIKSLNTGDKHKCDCLIKRWFLVDYKEAFKFDFLVQNGANLVEVFKHLSQVRKCYKKFKYYEFRVARDTAIQSAINKCMKNFSFNKGGIIRSILERSFHKIVLDHLVIGNELVLDPIEVKSRVDSIMVN
ncbi:hypothetical protein G9A89_016081 [Geosiphon pyriformis]|nr:hypothetical protein G9A89_016081 [Geosiphon pyriformis]